MDGERISKEDDAVSCLGNLELRFDLLGEFIGCRGSLVIVGWSIRIQLT